jgi:hypothetical protein
VLRLPEVLHREVLMRYLVVQEFEVEADSPTEAAREAYRNATLPGAGLPILTVRAFSAYDVPDGVPCDVDLEKEGLE